jgi:hypothetical protein
MIYYYENDGRAEKVFTKWLPGTLALGYCFAGNLA